MKSFWSAFPVLLTAFRIGERMDEAAAALSSGYNGSSDPIQSGKRILNGATVYHLDCSQLNVSEMECQPGSLVGLQLKLVVGYKKVQQSLALMAQEVIPAISESKESAPEN